MSISSAPSSTASRTSASLTSSGDWPDGNAVATDATFTLEPASCRLRHGDEVRVHADGGDRRDRAVGRVGTHRLRAERRHLAGRVRPLERRQIHHPDRELERRELRPLLDRPLRELAGPRLERDRVDGADARQPQIERKLEVARKQLGLRHRGKSSPARFRAVARTRPTRYRVLAMALGANAKIELLKSAPLFEQCSKSELQQLARIADELDLPAGKVLMHGRRARPGVLRHRQRRGRGAPQGAQGRRTLGPGSFVGEIALLSKIPRVATVTALTPLDVLVITDRAFLDLIDEVARARGEGRPDARRARRRERAQRPAARPRLAAWAPSTRACSSSPRVANFAALTVRLRSGAAMTHVMWVDADDDHVLINTEVHRAKFKAVERDPRRDGDDLGQRTIRTPTPRCAAGSSRRCAARRPERTSTRCRRSTSGRDYDPASIQSERVILRIAPDVQHIR